MSDLVGDIIFFKKDKRILSRTIGALTKSNFTHVGLIASQIKNTNIVLIIDSERRLNTSIRAVSINLNRHAIYSLKNKDKYDMDRVISVAYGFMGLRYNYFKIMGMFISLISSGKRYRIFNNKNRVICSELIDMSYYLADVRRLNDVNLGNVTPIELLRMYDLEEVKDFTGIINYDII